MIDFTENDIAHYENQKWVAVDKNKESNFRKAGLCFIKTFVFLALGVRDWVYNLSKRAVVIIFCTLLALVCIGWTVDYMNMKTRLTTAEWQRDSMLLKLDSIHELNSRTAEYSRIEYR